VHHVGVRINKDRKWSEHTSITVQSFYKEILLLLIKTQNTMAFTTVSKVTLGGNGTTDPHYFKSLDVNLVSNQNGSLGTIVIPAIIAGIHTNVTVGVHMFQGALVPMNDPDNLAALPCPPFDRHPDGMYLPNPDPNS
jgi:hypothetical protein